VWDLVTDGGSLWELLRASARPTEAACVGAA
jgi:hypothetical protein